MSVKTIYKCDRCGAEQETPTQFWKVGVAIKAYDSNQPLTPSWLYHKDSGYSHQGWCRKCVDALCLIAAPPQLKDAEVSVPPPSLEERMMAILGEIVEVAVENRIEDLRGG